MSDIEIPDYLEGLPAESVARSNRPFEVEDLGSPWGSEGLNTGNYEPESALRLIVRAIVAGADLPGKSRRSREDRALNELVGGPGPGRRLNEDYELLLEIARRYREAFWTAYAQHASPDWKKEWVPPLDPIIRAVVPDDHPACANRIAENVRKQIARKFRKQRDLLVARAAADDDHERLDRTRRIHEVLRAMQRLGIQVDTSVLPVRRKRRDKNGAI